jgi:hypothetical protein
MIVGFWDGFWFGMGMAIVWLIFMAIVGFVAMLLGLVSK